MALVFGGAATDRVAVTAASPIDDLAAFSVLLWVYPTTLTANRRLWSKGTTGQRRLGIESSSGDIGLIVSRATLGAESITVTGVLATNTWICLAATWDGTNAPKIYKGTPGTALAEVSYASQDAGSGAVTSESGGALNWGNRTGSNSAFEGRIAVGMLFNAALSVGQLRIHQFAPRTVAGCVNYFQLGYAGTGTQRDLSGNATHGTVTGATVGAHAPLAAPFGFDGWLPYAVAAAAAAGAPPPFGSLYRPRIHTARRYAPA